MFVTVLHKVHDPERLQKAEEKAVEAVREVVEGAVGAWANNEYYQIHVDGLTPSLG